MKLQRQSRCLQKTLQITTCHLSVPDSVPYNPADTVAYRAHTAAAVDMLEIQADQVVGVEEAAAVNVGTLDDRLADSPKTSDSCVAEVVVLENLEHHPRLEVVVVDSMVILLGNTGPISRARFEAS